MKMKMKRLVAIMLSIVMLFGIIGPANVYAEDGSSENAAVVETVYKKVTDTSSVADGNYLIVTTRVQDGNSYALGNVVIESGSYAGNITISKMDIDADGNIASGAVQDQHVWSIAAVDGGYSIQNKENQNYLKVDKANKGTNERAGLIFSADPIALTIAGSGCAGAANCDANGNFVISGEASDGTGYFNCHKNGANAEGGMGTFHLGAAANHNSHLHLYEENITLSADAISEVTKGVGEESVYTEESWSAYQSALAAVAGEFASEEAAIAAMTALEEAVAGLTEKPVVDKAALEAKVAEYADVDTTAYTEETAAAFAEALAKAQEVASKEDATQEEVNEALAALEAAFAGLTEKPEEPAVSYAFDSAVLAENAKANSEQLPEQYTNDGGAAWAFEDNDSWWHSRYMNWDQKAEWEVGSAQGDGKPEKNPIWIETGFDKVWYVESLTYTGRPELKGLVKDYTVSVANLEDPTQAPTDEDYTVVKTGTLEITADAQTIALDEVVAATHVRLTVTSVYQGHAENGQDLGDGHVAAKKIEIYGYDKMPEPEVPEVDKAALEAKVEEYAAVDTTVYTEETAAAFAEAFEAAQAVAAKEDATQEEVDEALAALEAAFAGLTEKPVDPEPEVDKAALEAKVAEYADVDTTAYTEETAAAFAEALAKAQEVAAKEDATQEEVNEALAALEAAFAGLTEKPVDPEPEKTYIPVKGVTAGDEELVNSNQSVEGPCGLAIDGDESTIWHTDWYVGPNYDDHWIQLEFDSAYMVGGFEYLPRQTGNTNGMITSYKIFVSEDGENWEEVAAGNWDSADRSWQTVEFDAVKAKYVRLKSEGGESDIGIALTCAAEIRAIGAAVECTEHQTELRGAKEADCTEAGYTGDTVCTICLTVVEKGKDIPALGHAWGEPVVVEATCTEDGSSTKTCATCGEEEKEVLKANGHTLGEYKVVKEATCTEAGSEEAECSVCKETETKEIPALGHAWGEWEEVTAAKYSAAGLEKRVCGTCGEAEEREIAKLANPFEDVQNDYYYDPVMWALDEGITTGQSATIFGVNVGTKREEVVTFLWRYAGSPEPTQTSCTFKDVEAGQYYYKAILWANEEGIVNGYNADKFGVGDTCKRQDIVKIFWGYAGNEEAENDTCEFTDVEAGQYYYPAVLWAVENKITTGQTATTFGVGEDCNRQDFVTFLYRLELLSAEEVAE